MTRRGGGTDARSLVASGRRPGPCDTCEIVGPTPRGQQAEVADADEAFREDVQEEAAEEFVDVERERADLTPVPIVLPPKRDRVDR